MTITTTLRAVVKAQAALQELSGYKPKGKFGYSAAKLVAKCAAELEEFNKARQVSIEAHGTFDEKQGAYTFLTQESQKALEKETNDLFDAVVTFEVSHLPYEEIEKLDPTVGLWVDLAWAISEPVAA